MSSCSPEDMGDSAQHQHPALPEKGNDGPKLYDKLASSSDNTIPSHSTLGPHPDKHSLYLPASLANPCGPAQEPLPDHGGDRRGSDSTCKDMKIPQLAPKTRILVACLFCRRRKIKCVLPQRDQACLNCQRRQQDCIFKTVDGYALMRFIPHHLAYPLHIQNMETNFDGCFQPIYANDLQLRDAYRGPIAPPVAVSPCFPDVPPTELCDSFADEKIEGGRKRSLTEPHMPLLPPPIPCQSYSSQNNLRRLAIEADLLLHTVILAAGAGSPKPSACSSKSRSLPQTLTPGEKFDLTNLKLVLQPWHQANEMDKLMLGKFGYM